MRRRPDHGSASLGEIYLYIGITSCDYKISQVSPFFNWYFIQIIQIRISNPAHPRLKQRDKLVFAGVHPRFAVIANQCAHWCGNPPVERNQVTITTRNRNVSQLCRAIVNTFTSIRGIATPLRPQARPERNRRRRLLARRSVRTGLAMTALFFKHQFVNAQRIPKKRPPGQEAQGEPYSLFSSSGRFS